MLLRFAFLFILCFQWVNAGQMDLRGNYQFFHIPQVEAIRQGAVDQTKGKTPGFPSGWGASGVLAFEWSNCCEMELRGEYARADSSDSVKLNGNSIYFYEITGNGNEQGTVANKGLFKVELDFYGADCLATCNLWSNDCHSISALTGFSYKRLTQQHHFTGEFDGETLNRFFVDDEVSTDYFGVMLGLRNESLINRCMLFTCSLEGDLYYASDCLRVQQELADNQFEVKQNHDEYAYYIEGRGGLTFINGCLTSGIHAFIGYLSYVPEVCHPDTAESGKSHIKDSSMERYGLELSVGLRY